LGNAIEKLDRLLPTTVRLEGGTIRSLDRGREGGGGGAARDGEGGLEEALLEEGLEKGGSPFFIPRGSGCQEVSSGHAVYKKTAVGELRWGEENYSGRER